MKGFHYLALNFNMKQKKSLGQNFLRSPKIISDIIKASLVQKSDIVLEIGPGQGILTYALLKTGALVISVEKDDRLIPELKEKFAKEIGTGQLRLIHADILNFDMPRVPLDNENISKMSKTAFDTRHPYKIVANIPYYITGQVIRKFLEAKNQPESMTLLLQKEVAERIVAKPNSRSVAQSAKGGFRAKDEKESLLSLSVKAFGNAKYIRTVGRGAFSPQPNVDSAILHISNISRKNFLPSPYVGHRVKEDGNASGSVIDKVGERLFFKILHAGFAHKRKQLLPNLSSLYPKSQLVKAFEKCGIDLKSRAEDIPFETWLKLCGHLISTEL